MDIEHTASRVKWFAEKSCRGESPLYEHLCLGMSADRRLLELVGATPPEQPVPNLMLAAVHFLLLGGVQHEVARYYPSCVAEPLPSEGAFAPYREFCLEYERSIRELLATRRVQTNEVGRCAYLLPSLSFIARQNPAQRLALIEVGTSAGLLLNWDRYAYDYGTGQRYGDPLARVLIQSEWRGAHRPVLGESMPKIVDRVGIDLHTLNLNDPQESLWLRSLVWPDQTHSLKLISDAIEQFQATPARLVKGDAFDLLPSAVESTPVDAAVCIFHCHTLNQFTPQQRRDFDALLAALSQNRCLIQLSAEWIGVPEPQLWLTYWNVGQPTAFHLANVDHHGRWVEWLAPA